MSSTSFRSGGEYCGGLGQVCGRKRMTGGEATTRLAEGSGTTSGEKSSQDEADLGVHLHRRKQ